ncbi:hypothetical protein B0H12DRAFT_1076016 [Mycena haematopus]|nr:hypothetical protein B0H12DRAFT_1076016 [Mycena haematopus]
MRRSLPDFYVGSARLTLTSAFNSIPSTHSAVQMMPSDFYGAWTFAGYARCPARRCGYLQHAFEVDDHLKREVDAAFEKERELLWEAANTKLDTKKSELYVNHDGWGAHSMQQAPTNFYTFLIQTRPDVDEPDLKSDSVRYHSSLALPPQYIM